MSEQLLTIKEAAQLLKVNVRTVTKWVKSGEIKAYELGPRITRLSQADIEEFIGKRETVNAEI